MSLKDDVQKQAKALMSALAGALVSVLMTTASDADSVLNAGESPVQLPNTNQEWVAFVVAVAIAYALPYMKRNYPSVFEAQSQLAIAQQRVEVGKQEK